MVTPSEYFENGNINNVPVPDWSHLNVKSPTSSPTVKLEWDKIYIDDIKGNLTKEKAHTAEEIEALRLSFSTQVDTTQFPPAVVYRGKEYAKPWKLVYGYGRGEALRLLKTKGWFFTVLEGTDDALEDVQAQENELLPKRINEEIDMRKFLIQKVIDGKIDKTEQAIREKFRKVYPYRRKETMNRVIPQVLAELGVELPYILYTSVPKVQDWINNHSKEEYVIGGEFDNERDMYGVQMKEGYQWRAVINAIITYANTGKKTYVICHCGAPTKKQTFSIKRKKILEVFDNLQSSLEKLGLKIWPIVVLGALPQDRKNENLKELVDMGSSKVVMEHLQDLDEKFNTEFVETETV